MARFLVLDWDHQQLHIVAATVKHGAVRVDKAVASVETQSPNPAEAEALGRLLRERLKSAGIAPAPVLVCVGRDRVIVKEVQHPAVSPHEEPALVRFQVVRELTDPAEDVVIDYMPLGGGDAAGPRRALALVLRRELMTAYQAICRAAGLKLAAVTPRSFGLAACVRRQFGTTVLTPAPPTPDAAVGVLAIGRPWAEFTVVQGDALLYARSLSAGPMLPGEVRRNVAVYAAQAPQKPIAAVYVAGGAEHAGVRDRLQELLGLPVYSFDPFGGAERPGLPAEDRGAFAAAMGLLYLRAEHKRPPINFAHPKQPKPPRDPNRHRVTAAAAVAAVLLVCVFGYCYTRLSWRNDELTFLTERKTELDGQIAALSDDLKKLKALDDWSKTEIVWLDELYDLTDRFPDPTSLRLTHFVGDSPELPGKSEYVGKLLMKGIMTNDLEPVNKLQSRLVTDGHYRVDPKIVARNTGADRFRFPQQWTSRVDIARRQPREYVRRLPDSLIPGRQQSDEGGDGGGFGGFGGGGFGGGFGGFGGGQP